MKKTLRMAIALLMAVVLTLNLPLGAYASEQPTYISEVKVGYGAAGKQALKDAGYTVREDLNMNPGGEGGDVWLGYKTTFNVKEAITDMALMNQGGGYDFQGWNEELEELQRNISDEVNRLEAAIFEFQAYLEAGSPYAKTAKKYLDMYIDDDENADTSDETGYSLGELIARYGKTPADGEKAVTKDNLVVIFMQGNSTSLQAIRGYLALGCTEYDAGFQGNTFIDRMAKAEATGEPDSDVENTDRSAALGAMEEVKSIVEDFEETLKDIGIYELVVDYSDKTSEAELKQYEDALSEYCRGMSGAEALDFMKTFDFYTSLLETQYTENLGFSMMDFIKLPTDMVDEDTLTIDDFVDPLVTSLTEGQRALICSVGFETIFTLAVVAGTKEGTDEYLERLEKTYTDMIAQREGTQVSVYDGVDRELFYDRETVALTSEASRDQALSAGNDFGRVTEHHAEVNKTLRNIAIGAAALGVASLIASGTIYAVKHAVLEGVTKYSLEAYANGQSLFSTTNFYGFFSDTTMTGAYAEAGNVEISTITTSLTSRTFLFWLGVVALIVALVLTIITLATFFKTKNETKEEKIVYSQIPRVLMDLRYRGANNTEKYYVPFYAAENIAAPAKADTVYVQSDLTRDSVRKYGDLNGLCEHCAWLTLYTTKDPEAGTPLTPDFKVVTGIDSSVLDVYLGIHMFGNSSAANLNQFQKNGAGAVYVYVKPYVAPDGTGSVFSKSASALALYGLGIFALGAAVASVATAGYYRKKERKTA